MAASPGCVKNSPGVGLVMGIRATTLIDIPNYKVRVELRVNDKLTSVEQLEGSNGWQWRNGRKAPLSAGRITEMINVFTTGVLGLRSANLAALPPPQITSTANGLTSVTYTRKGTKFICILDADNRLVGEGNTLNQRLTSVSYSDFKTGQWPAPAVCRKPEDRVYRAGYSIRHLRN